MFGLVGFDGGKTRKYKERKRFSPAGNRTPVSRVTGGDTHHYTTEDSMLCIKHLRWKSTLLHYLLESGCETIQLFWLGSFHLSVESNWHFLGLCIMTLSDWLKKLASLCYPIRCKTQSNRDLLAHVCPRFASAKCICFVF